MAGALQAVEVQTRQGKGSFNTFVTLTPRTAARSNAVQRHHEVLSAQVTSFRQKSEAAEILVLCSECNKIRQNLIISYQRKRHVKDKE